MLGWVNGRANLLFVGYWGLDIGLQNNAGKETLYKYYYVNVNSKIGTAVV
jgi:hypothetical protein